MTQNKNFISESYAWPGYGYITVKGAGTWWIAGIGASTKIRRFSFRLKAIWR